MSDQDTFKIIERLTRLEAAWGAHGESSNIFREDIKRSLLSIQQDVRKITSEEHLRRESCFKRARGYTNWYVGVVLGIPLSITAIIVSISWVMKTLHGMQ